MATAVLQDLRLLEVTTPLGANAVVINKFEGTDRISGPFRFQLELLANVENKSDGEIKAIDAKVKTLLGKATSVKLEYEDSPQHFHGLVAQITTLPRDLRFLRYQAVVVPWLWLMTLKSDLRIFQDKTVVEIVKAVFDDLKSSFPEVSYRDATTGNHVPLDYCVQYRESDFNFVSRLLEQEGIFYFWEYSENKHTMVLVDSNASLKKIEGKSQVLFIDGGIGDREGVIYTWQEQTELRSSKFTFRDHHFQLPSKPLEVTDQTQDTSAPPLEFYDYPGEFALRFKNPDSRLGEVEKEGDKLVRMRLDAEVLPSRVFTGCSTRRNLGALHRFTLSHHPTDDGDYIVTEIEYNAAQTPDYITNEPPRGVVYHNRITCVPAETRIRPRRATSKPIAYGPHTAVVSVKSGEESWLDKFGRVRVQFHWERKGKNNETSACWVRVAQFWAGAAWGAHFWPRVGQEVVVEFLGGDPDRPIITGSVYNAANMPPYPLPDNYTRSGILTRSSKHGGSQNFNELRFEDKKGEEQIFLNAEKDMDHRVEKDHRVFIGANQHLIVKAAQTELIEGNKHEHVKAEHVEKVDSNASRDVGGDHKEKIAGKLSLVVGGAQHQTVGNIYTLQAGDEIHLQAGTKIVLDAREVSIKGAGGFVDVGMSGVAIQGTIVNINSGGSASSGTAASPDAPASPKDPDVADDGSKGAKLS